MNSINNFHTFKGYQLNFGTDLTSSMEDYIEMLFRLKNETESLHVVNLAEKLNVKASSVTKMIETLNRLGYTTSKKYGEIFLTEKGVVAGEYLLYRHNVIHSFLCALNHSNDELEQTEKIEHFISKTTVTNLEKITKKLKKYF